MVAHVLVCSDYLLEMDRVGLVALTKWMVNGSLVALVVTLGSIKQKELQWET